MSDAQIAGSSPAPEPAVVLTAADQAVVSGDQASYREARRAERAGKPLDPTKTAAPEAAPPAEQDASTEVVPEAASEAAKPRKDAADRVKELLAERARERERAERAERRLAEFESRQPQPIDDKPAAPSAAPATFPSYDEFLKGKPDASYEDYLDARTEFRVEQKVLAREAQARHEAEQQRRTQSVRERDEKFRERLGTVTKADPEFLEKCSDDVKSLRPFSAIRDGNGRWTEQPNGRHAVAEEILSSPVGPQLMRHFSDHPDDLRRIASLTPRDLLREMGKLEARMGDAKAPAAPKTVTDAPPPPTFLGNRPSAAADPVDAAVAADDVAAYRKARLAERLAGRK